MLKRGRAAKMAEMIKGIADRDKAGRSYYTSNGYTYELHPDYGRGPGWLRVYHVFRGML